MMTPQGQKSTLEDLKKWVILHVFLQPITIFGTQAGQMFGSQPNERSKGCDFGHFE